jgi:hypothetical protein
MILHFSHIGLTDGRTFMIPFGCYSGELALAAAAGRRYQSRMRARKADGPSAHGLVKIAKRGREPPCDHDIRRVC